MHRSSFLVAALALSASVAHGAVVVADSVVITNTNFTPAFHITEIQVFEQGTGVNVAAAAQGSSAVASSTGWGTQPAWAIDGGTDGAFGSNTTWHDTDGEGGDLGGTDFIRVTFPAARNVDTFDVFGRSDCCPERDDNFSVQFFNGGNLVGENLGVGIFNAVPNSTGVTPITAIPEPQALALLALGALALRRRKA